MACSSMKFTFTFNISTFVDIVMDYTITSCLFTYLFIPYLVVPLVVKISPI
jgi:hypothetical protein